MHYPKYYFDKQILFDESGNSNVDLRDVLEALHSSSFSDKRIVRYLLSAQGFEYSTDAFNPCAAGYLQENRKLEQFLNSVDVSRNEAAKLNFSTLKVLEKMMRRGIRFDLERLQSIVAEYKSAVSLSEGDFQQQQKKIKLIENVSHCCEKDAGQCLHPKYHVFGTVSGRITTTTPNYQGLPKMVREECVVPRQGRCYILGDFIAEEIVLMLALAHDEDALQQLLAGRDFHTETAAEVYGIPLAEVTELQRTFSKRLNFLYIYGGGTSALQQKLDVMAAPMSVQQLRVYLQQCFPWIEQLKENIQKQGYIRTLTEEQLPLTIVEPYKWVNHLIQRVAAELLKIILVELDKRLPIDCYVVACIHDEVMIDVPLEKIEEAEQILHDVMKHSLQRSNQLKGNVASMPVKITIKKGSDSHSEFIK